MFLLFFLSIDSLIAAFALGLLGLPSERKYRMCFLFGLCDGLATLAGPHLKYASAPMPLSDHPFIVPAAICAWIILVAVMTRQRVVTNITGTAWASIVPFALGMDNLFAGMASSGETVSGLTAPVATFFMSTSLALVGYSIAEFLRNRISRSLTDCAGASLLMILPILF
jgi:putative Mn2+ efflux pump MntP